MDGHRATKSEGVGLIVRAISSKISSLSGPDPPTLQTDDTDGRMTCDRKTALCTLVHSAVKSQTRSDP